MEDEENVAAEDEVNEEETGDATAEESDEINIAPNHECSPVKQRKLRRILNTFSDDSDDESSVTDTLTKVTNEKDKLSSHDSTMSCK